MPKTKKKQLTPTFSDLGLIQESETPIPFKVLSVIEVTTHIKGLLEKNSALSRIWVQGEVSNLVKAASGHCYFTLKDSKAVLRAALWAQTRRSISHDFKNGDLVLVYGSITVYQLRGEYQINVADVRPAGVGALYEALERLKSKLSAEGLFDPERKLPLPFIPKGVGVVTSKSGAVIQDIFRVIRRRFNNMPIYLVPVKVQGEGAANEIAEGIRRLNSDNRVDVIIIGRGGGSLEDLWCFNEEAVARAIAASVKPIISSVGHETDTTIADLVADMRAATPSVAGELVVPQKADLQREIAKNTARLQNTLKNRIALERERYMRSASCRFLTRSELLISDFRVAVINLSRDLTLNFKAYVTQKKHVFELLKSRLSGQNPRVMLNKGYIMATDEQNRVVSSVSLLKPGRPVKLRFADGTAKAIVSEIKAEG